EERDRVQILSGVFDGETLGTPIQMLIQNEDVDSEPYEERKGKPRPGHADLTYKLKYGHVDYRGGGRSSGRETVGRVAGGAIAKKLLESEDIDVIGHTLEAAGVSLNKKVDLEEIEKNVEENAMRCADSEVAERMREAVMEAREEGDSTGGIVEVLALNVPAGLGEPVFEKLDAEIARALMSIGAVKGVEIGLGFESAGLKGSEVNDEFELGEGGIIPETNNAGGILGGISTGAPIIARMAVKPTPSISKPQQTVDLDKMEEAEIELSGRHDPNICPRIVPVAENMLALLLADMMLRSGRINPDRLEGVK
ncbi:chorismate synthase, partial [candidate division MSBL1 archaeon SCGC-AAA259O05]